MWTSIRLSLFIVASAMVVSAELATLTSEAVGLGYTLKMTATGFPEANFEQLAGVVAFNDAEGNPKIMVDGIPSGGIYILDDVDGQAPPEGQPFFTPVSTVPTSGAQAMAVIGDMVYLADALNFQIIQIGLDGTPLATPLVNFLPIRPTALAVNALNNHLIVAGGGQVLDIDPLFESFTQYTVLIPDWGTGGVAFSEDFSTLFVEGGVWGSPVVRRYKINGLNATRDTSHADIHGSEQMFGLVVGTGCLSPSLFMSAASGFYEVAPTGTMRAIISANGAGFLARDEKDGCLLFTSDQLYRLCPPACGGFVGITPVPVNACATNNGGCPAHSECSTTITGAPSCVCSAGYISRQPTNNDCIAVNLAGTWSELASADTTFVITQSALTFSVSRVGGNGQGWTSATGFLLSAGAVRVQFNDNPNVWVNGVVFNAAQKQVDLDNGSTWMKRVPVGSECATNGDCSSGICVNGRCVAAPTDQPCASNNDCSSHNCGHNGKCSGNGVGGRCSSSSDCLSNILCQVGKCQGVNSCYTANGGCHPDAICTPNGSNHRKCKCNSGYSGSGVGLKGCAGPCRGNPAARHGGTINCNSNMGYVLDGAVCDLVCPAGFFARGSFKCDDGHWKDKDPLCSAATCSHPDLAAIAHASAGTCTGKRTYHDCLLGCQEGFLPAGNTHAICLGTTGSHSAYSFNAYTCNDIDECSYLPRKCGDGWQCTNSIGSYSCIPLAPRLDRKSGKEISLKWTRLGDTPRLNSLQVHVTSTVAGFKKVVKVDGAQWSDYARITDLTPGTIYTFVLVAVLHEPHNGVTTLTGLPLTLVL